ncbi:uncharacterized protein SAZU_1879 [Streptomyces azureus]|uniref:Uncharacterized protein n=1 Tax=Streptomyces azureus TaxID=146537 RepID=A0A0K8PGX5_STRAJ|nr:uncharacterized protein SAZU_1879 [Streptomyces azureus]
MQAGDAEHGVVNAVAFQPAVAKDLPVLHPGEDVLHAGADFVDGRGAQQVDGDGLVDTVGIDAGRARSVPGRTGNAGNSGG